MGVMHHRKRVAARVPEGGGLTAESLTDTATDDDIFAHYSGADPAGVVATAVLDYDVDYGPLGTSEDRPVPDPYTLEEARKDAAGYDEVSFPTAQDVKDVAQQWEAKTVVFAPAAVGDAPYYLAGQDQRRKRIIIKNTSVATVDASACDVAVGADPTVSRYNGYVLKGGTVFGVPARVSAGESVVLEHTGDVYIIPCLYSGVAPESVTVSYVIERYAQ